MGVAAGLVIDLDDAASLAQADPSDFLGSVERFPAQLREAWGIAADASPPPLEGIASVVVLGMGGSGISGDVLCAVAAPASRLVWSTFKGYSLPAWVGPASLVFAVSYSGDTEETLAAFDEARRRGARLFVVAGGGALEARGREAGCPVVRIPLGLQPRAALGYLTVPILAVCGRARLLPELQADLSETIDLMEARSAEWGRSSPAAENEAKRLTAALAGRVGVVWGGEGPGQVAAYRWKCQLNETSKTPAFSNVFSELNHNEVMGWELPQGSDPPFALVLLRHGGDHPRVTRRMEVTAELVRHAFAWVEQVVAAGGSALARLFDLVYLGDFVSTYLALGRGVDPAPVDTISRLKRSL